MSSAMLRVAIRCGHRDGRDRGRAAAGRTAGGARRGPAARSTLTPVGRASRPGSSLPLTGSNAAPMWPAPQTSAFQRIGQADEGGHAGIVRPAELGGDRAHRRIAAAVRPSSVRARQRVAGLHRDRRVVAGRAIDRADHGQLVHESRLQRQVLAEADARHAGRDRRYGPRISAGAVRLGSHMSIWLGPPESQKRMTAF